MNYAVLDLETTGPSAEDDIIQVGVVIVSEQLEMIHSYSSFVKPTKPIPSFITQLTGIDEKLVEDAPELDDMLMELIPHLEDAVLVAHNVGFDVGFLNQSLDRCGYLPFTGRRLDTIELLRILYPTITTYQLGAVAELFGAPHELEHRADSDAKATAHIFISCMKKMLAMPLLTMQRLSALIDEAKDLHWLLKQVEQMLEQQIFESNDVDYFRQFAIKVTDWTEEVSPRANKENGNQTLEEVSFESYLSEIKDRFSEKFLQYETRESQDQMFHNVYDALSSEKHLLIEAGTGTGKSLGYLIPSLYYSVQSGNKIVVSTHTINLQEQLRERDIPLLEEVLPFPFKVSVFKGRGNYLCLRKFEGKINTQDMVSPVEDRITASQMLVWLGETESGDQEELNFGAKGSEFWSTVSSDTESCLNRACPWFKRCYYHRAKHEATIADLCITNHSMLFTDVQADHRLLPTYSHLIIDEAHHVEEVAGKHLGMNIHYYSLVQTFIRLYKDNRNGLLPLLKLRLEQSDDEYKASWIETIDTIIPEFHTIRDHWDTLFEMFYTIASTTKDAWSENGSAVIRLKQAMPPSEWTELQGAEDNLFVELGKCLRKIEKVIQDAKDRVDELAVQAVLTDVNGAIRELSRLRDELRLFVKLEEQDNVFWIEANQTYRFRSVHLNAAPVDVSDKLQKYFFDMKDSIILTSATLTVQKNFQYAEEQLGLTGYEEQGKLRTVQLSSPFNYREQALVVIPRDFPTLKGAYIDSAYIDKLVQSLSETAAETRGRMLVLFTSYKMLKQIYEPLKAKLNENGIALFGQGVDSNNRSKLTRRFLQQSESVLLGTSSFWEGVDIPGDALTCLAIVRLPFQPPNHPVVEAKAELLQRHNQNPFMKLSIPQAVIRFKQGFGRLVRSTKDKGIVIVYDTRIIDTYYGKHFLYSLPGPKIETMFTDQLVPRIRQWLNEEGVTE